MEMNHVLIVEDDKEIREGVKIYLKSKGYVVSEAADGVEGLEIIEKEEIHLAIVDVMMPRMDGITMTMKLRENHDFPVIFLSAKSEEVDKILGLDMGADDYVTKPFSVTVLCKKVAAVFANLELRTPRHDLFDDGFLKIDFSEQSASLAGESLDFTPKEYRTLFLFVKNPRIILTKRQILEKLWDIDGDFVDEHTLTTIISRIRKKIETDEHKYIKTAYGMGYQWTGGELK